jgi:hypothetical protein
VLIIEGGGTNPHDHPMVQELCGVKVASLSDAIEATISILGVNR